MKRGNPVMFAKNLVRGLEGGSVIDCCVLHQHELGAGWSEKAGRVGV